MGKIQCPHCEKLFDISHSAFVTGRELLDGQELTRENYHPDPTKEYKTSLEMRLRGLEYYWKNRDKVLDREKRRRAEQQDVSVSIHDG